jgi:hypothetical protein
VLPYEVFPHSYHLTASSARTNMTLLSEVVHFSSGREPSWFLRAACQVLLSRREWLITHTHILYITLFRMIIN